MASQASIAPHILLLLMLLLAVVHVDAKREFVARIPNGDNVGSVHALGHIAWDGDGPLNAFGEAFAAAGFKWTRSLCNGDADGDGQTNGEELGDPCCKWVAGSGELPLITDVVSHPGDFGRKLNATDLRHRQRVCQASESQTTSSSSGVGLSAGTASPGDVDVGLKSGRPPAPPPIDLPGASSSSSLRARRLHIFMFAVPIIFIFIFV